MEVARKDGPAHGQKGTQRLNKQPHIFLTRHLKVTGLSAGAAGDRCNSRPGAHPSKVSTSTDQGTRVIHRSQVGATPTRCKIRDHERQ